MPDLRPFTLREIFCDAKPQPFTASPPFKPRSPNLQNNPDTAAVDKRSKKIFHDRLDFALPMRSANKSIEYYCIFCYSFYTQPTFTAVIKKDGERIAA